MQISGRWRATKTLFLGVSLSLSHPCDSLSSTSGFLPVTTVLTVTKEATKQKKHKTVTKVASVYVHSLEGTIFPHEMSTVGGQMTKRVLENKNFHTTSQLQSAVADIASFIGHGI